MYKQFSREKHEAEVNSHSYKSLHTLDSLLKNKHNDREGKNVTSTSTCNKQHVSKDKISSIINSHEQEEQNIGGFPIMKFKSSDLCSVCKRVVAETTNTDLCSDCRRIFVETSIENKDRCSVCKSTISETANTDLCSDCRRIVSEKSIKHTILSSSSNLLEKTHQQLLHDDRKKLSEDSTNNIRKKIRNMMKNHSDAMLVKRVEQKEQLILEPSNSNTNFETIKRNKMSTRYYIAPLHKSNELIFKNENISVSKQSVEAIKPEIVNNVSDTSIASKYFAKKEVSNILKSLKITSDGNKVSMIKDKVHRGTTHKVTCPKITVSQIRSYVENKMLDPSERQLHEIIKVETIGNKISEQNSGRNYTINIPKGDSRNINIVKIKEKRKLQINNIDGTNEVANIRQSIPLQAKEENYDIPDQHTRKPVNIIKKVENTPIETRIFEVKTRQTPVITPLVDENKRNRVLLIEHEANYKSKRKGAGIDPSNLKKTQLLSIKQECEELSGEIYMYDTENDGKRVRENVNKIEVVSPSLKQKVNSIFEELKEITFRQKTPEIIKTSKTHVCSGTNTEYNQYLPSKILTDRDLHDVKSASVQVQSSELLTKDSSKRHSKNAYSLPSLAKSLNVASKEALNIASKEPLKEATRGKIDYLRGPFKKPELSDSQKEISASETTIKEERSMLNTLGAPVVTPQLSKDKTEPHLLKTGSFKEITDEAGMPLVTDKMKSSLKTTESQKLMPIQDQKLDLFKDNKLSFDLGKEETDSVIDLNKQNDNLKMYEEVTHNLEDQEREGSVKEEIIDTQILNEDLYQHQKNEKDNEQHGDTNDNEQNGNKYDYEQHADKYGHEQHQGKQLEDIYDNEKNADQLDNEQHHDKYHHEQPSNIGTPVSQQSSLKSKLGLKTHFISDSSKTITPPNSYIGPKIPQNESNFLLEDIKSQIDKPVKSEFEEDEDTRSYSIDSNQGIGMKFISDSKFIHNKEAVRKRMNWTDNTIYLERNMCPQLISALVDTAVRRPADPISHLANWIYKDYHNKVKEEEKLIFKEHLNLARAMNTLHENIDPNISKLSEVGLN